VVFAILVAHLIAPFLSIDFPLAHVVNAVGAVLGKIVSPVRPRILSITTSIGSGILTIRSCILPVVSPIRSRVLTVCSGVLAVVNSISTVFASRPLTRSWPLGR
jgi:phage-related protein